VTDNRDVQEVEEGGKEQPRRGKCRFGTRFVLDSKRDRRGGVLRRPDDRKLVLGWIGEEEVNWVVVRVRRKRLSLGGNSEGFDLVVVQLGEVQLS